MTETFVPDGFSFLKQLTPGFYGPSYLIKNEKTNDQYICKSFAKNAIGDETDVANFLTTIRASRKIKEKCFLPYHAVHDIDSQIYCIRPFFEGLNLTAYIANLDVDFNLIFAQWKVVVRLYRHLHKHKIFPNFIKPSNIFLDSGKIAFITDIYQPPRQFNPMVHKPNPFDVGFLAPEFLQDDNIPTIQSDIWSLGILLWFMAMKTLPWNISNAVVMLKQIQKGTPDMITEIPSDIREILEAILQKDPNVRTPTELLIHCKPGLHDDNPVKYEKTQQTKNVADPVSWVMHKPNQTESKGAFSSIPVRRRKANEEPDMKIQSTPTLKKKN